MERNNIRIAIVEDNEKDAGIIRDCLARYSIENGVKFDIASFANGLDFISQYKECYDIILMDIDMPLLNGMDAAAKLRETDPVTQLVFITNLSQYAINGYEVDACAYILKPVTYYSFALRFAKAVNRVKKQDDYIVVPKSGGIVKLFLDNIYYVEVTGHMLTYHTSTGDVSARGTIAQLESDLADSNFARCNSHYLVNLAHVTSLKGLSVYVNGVQIAMSRGRRNEFRDKLSKYQMYFARTHNPGDEPGRQPAQEDPAGE
ncbi:MAG: LytTR family DNA-binding domain-containing protein [Clostridia bacterium]|nr:LytTR family DNA-binding domain-containing protein [Clostridia bacterium]